MLTPLVEVLEEKGMLTQEEWEKKIKSRKKPNQKAIGIFKSKSDLFSIRIIKGYK